MKKQIEKYLELGLQPIPVPHRSKAPRNKDWQKYSLKGEDLLNVFSSKELNVGILLGEPSNGLVDIDLDCPEAIALAPYFLPKTRTFGRASSPQSHWLYKSPDTKTKKFQFEGMILEIRSTGSQTIFPPSVHESGEEITFDSNNEITSIDNKKLTVCCGELAAASLIAKVWKSSEPGRQNLALALAGAFAHSGKTQKWAEKFIKTIINIVGDEESESRMKAVSSTYAKYDQGDTVTGWNKLSDLLEQGVCKNLKKWLKIRNSPPSASRRNTISLVPISEIQEEKMQYFFGGRIVKGKVTLFSGDPGLGKTFVSLKLCSLLSNGEMWTEDKNQKVAPGNSLFITAEDGISDTIKPRLTSLGADQERIFVYENKYDEETGQAMGLFTIEDISNLKEQIKEREIKMVIIDPIQAFVGKDCDMNAANKVRPVFSELGRLAEETGAAIIVIGHLNKGSGNKVAYRSLGSIDFVAAARSVLVVGKCQETLYVFHSKSSTIEKCDAIEYHISNDTLEFGCEVGLDEDDLFGLENDTQNKFEKAKIVIATFLKNGPQIGTIVTDILEAVGISKSTANRAANELNVTRSRSNTGGSRGQGHWIWSFEEVKKTEPESGSC